MPFCFTIRRWLPIGSRAHSKRQRNWCQQGVLGRSSEGRALKCHVSGMSVSCICNDSCSHCGVLAPLTVVAVERPVPTAHERTKRSEP